MVLLSRFDRGRLCEFKADGCIDRRYKAGCKGAVAAGNYGGKPAEI